MAAPRANQTLVVLFLLVISLPLAANIAGMDGADPESENRAMARLPHLDVSLRSLAGYGNAFSAWFEDHFGFRATLVRWYGESRFFWLGVSPSSAVVKGRDGWLFYADDGGIEDYTNQQPFSPAEIEGWRETLVRAHGWLRARGIAYVFTIAPDKHVIYPEKLPASIHRVSTSSRTDQLEAMLAADTDVPTVDARPALLAGKARERLYQQTDTHWNDRGALLAYQRIIEAARRQVPSVPPAWTAEDFEPAERVVPGMDLARMMA